MSFFYLLEGNNSLHKDMSNQITVESSTTLSLFLSLFLQFPNNNILHSHIESTVKVILTGEQAPKPKVLEHQFAAVMADQAQVREEENAQQALQWARTKARFQGLRRCLLFDLNLQDVSGSDSLAV